MENNNETKHTSTPWKISPIHPNEIKGDVGTGLIATVSENRHNEWEANAQFIIKACNNHDALVEALKLICNDAKVLSLGENSNTVKVMIESINKGIRALKNLND